LNLRLLPNPLFYQKNNHQMKPKKIRLISTKNTQSIGNALPSRILLSLSGLSLLLLTGTSHAAGLTATDGAAGDDFGYSGSNSGSNGLFGALLDNSAQGSAYVFRNLDIATGTVTQNVKLTASDGAAGDHFGISVGMSGNIGLVGAYADTIGANPYQGSAYVFRNLNTATGTVVQNVKLLASDGTAYDRFGSEVSLSGSIGLVGAFGDGIGSNAVQGSAYIYRNLDTATGTVSQNVKLIASDGAANDGLGSSVSQSGNIALVGAGWDDIGANSDQGSAYVFRNLNTATGTVTQNVKLIASDGGVSDYFGSKSSLSGNIGLIGASYDNIGANNDQGSAYVFRNLDTATGTVNQNVKLTASDGASDDAFGGSVSQSGSLGLVGSMQDDIGANSNQGSVYLFRNLDTTTGAMTENLKLTASDGESGSRFGSSVSLSGDQFVIGASGKNSNTGKAYSGSISSVTTLDTGNTSTTISGISFTSQDDWIIGQTTDSNQVTLSAGDNANVTAIGMTVDIGQLGGSDSNTLILAGSLTANDVNIGTSGNLGNTLRLMSTSSLTASAIKLAAQNYFSIQGDYTDINTLLAYLGSTPLETLNGETWQAVTAGNYTSKISSSYSSGFTTITPIPEPGSFALILLTSGTLLLRRKRG
jgi:hypothetical protein